MVFLSSLAALYCVYNLNISHSDRVIFPMLNGSFTTTAMLKSIQTKFHPIELTLGQENVHIMLRLSYSWGPHIGLFQDCFQAFYFGLWVRCIQLPPPPKVSSFTLELYTSPRYISKD